MNETVAQETNLIRSVLKSEITWLILIITGIMSFVSAVVLPIQHIQLQIEDVQLAIQNIQTTEKSTSNQTTQNTLDIQLLKQKIGLTPYNNSSPQ